MTQGKAWHTNSESPYTLTSGFLLLLENFEIFPDNIFFCFAWTHFPGSSFCVIIGEQLEFQFIHFSNTSRSRFVTAFCPCTTHFSERPATSDSFENNFDFAQPQVFRSVKICLNYVATSDQFEVIPIGLSALTYSVSLIHYLNCSVWELQHFQGHIISLDLSYLIWKLLPHLMATMLLLCLIQGQPTIAGHRSPTQGE